MKKLKGVSNLTYALLTVPIILIVATAIFSNFQSNIDRSGWTAEANYTFSKVTSGTWSGYNLASLLPFVLIAVVIVGVILGALALR
jgi:hypothetical protein